MRQPGQITQRIVAALVDGMPTRPKVRAAHELAGALAVREPAFWPMLPELIAKGASPEACNTAPWVALAQANPCPDFSHAAPAQLDSLRSEHQRGSEPHRPR